MSAACKPSTALDTGHYECLRKKTQRNFKATKVQLKRKVLKLVTPLKHTLGIFAKLVRGRGARRHGCKTEDSQSDCRDDRHSRDYAIDFSRYFCMLAQFRRSATDSALSLSGKYSKQLSNFTKLGSIRNMLRKRMKERKLCTLHRSR